MAFLAPIEIYCRHCCLAFRRDGSCFQPAVNQNCPGHDFIMPAPAPAPADPAPTDRGRRNSPRLMSSVFILIAFINGGYTPVGSSFIVPSHSGTLLLTAHHCLQPGADHHALVKTITRNDDGTYVSEPPVPIKVEAVAGDPVADVAVLRAERVLEGPIPLCPIDQYPVPENEDVVKSYYCPCQLFNDEQTDLLGVMATDLVKVTAVSRHHILILSEHRGSSGGGVVVDEQGRAVGLICSGRVEGAPLVSISSSLETVWDNATASSNGTALFVKATKLSAVALGSFLQNH